MSTATMQTQQRPWWMTLIGGIAAFIIGASILWGSLGTKVDTYMLVVQLIGIYWLVTGIIDLVYMFIDHSQWGWKLFMGIVSIIAGWAILVYPVVAAVQLPKIFVLVLGIWGVFYGIALLVMAFRGGGWGAGILGAIGIVFGFILMFNYNAIGMGLTFVWTAAVMGVIGGIIMIVQAFRQRKA